MTLIGKQHSGDAPVGGQTAHGVTSSGLAVPLKVDDDGVLQTSVSGAGSGGTSSTDEATFTPTVSAGTAVMGARDDTATDTLAEGKIGIARMTEYRALHMNIRASDGTEITKTGTALDVNIASGSSSGTQYTEDDASVSNPVGNQIIARRRDTLSAETTTDGDNTALNSTAKGELYVKHVDSVPVTGTVTANIGTVADLATATKQDTIISYVDGIEGLLTTIDVDTGNIDTNVSAINTKIATAKTSDFDTGAGTDTVQMMGLALPKSGGAVAGGTATDPIRTDPTGTTIQPISGSVTATITAGATEIAKAEDSASADADVGVPAMAVRKATPANTSGTDGDYEMLQMSAGRLWVDASGKTLTVDGTVAVSGTPQVIGSVAHDGVDANGPVKVGGRARTSEITAVASDDRVDAIFDKTGKQIVLPYANPENFVSGCITSAMTGTSSTSLIAAPASGLRNYITQITVSNTHATAGTNIELQDGSGGTTFYIIPAAAVYGGAVLTFPTPLQQPTTATALYCKNSTTGASTFVSASGYKGA